MSERTKLLMKYALAADETENIVQRHVSKFLTYKIIITKVSRAMQRYGQTQYLCILAVY